MPKKNANAKAAYGSETFPDLHHKMSKKVAQLTKVIYHLNTRNEDFQVDLKSTQSSHASEVEEILQDAADKINAFKAKLAKAQQNGATAVALQKLKKQHRSEKDEVRTKSGLQSQYIQPYWKTGTHYWYRLTKFTLFFQNTTQSHFQQLFSERPTSQ